MANLLVDILVFYNHSFIFFATNLILSIMRGAGINSLLEKRRGATSTLQKHYTVIVSISIEKGGPVSGTFGDILENLTKWDWVGRGRAIFKSSETSILYVAGAGKGGVALLC
jgi:hypothetical protein